MSQENVELVRERYQQVNRRGFAAVADFLSPEFTMNSPQDVEASQAHDKAGLQKWFEKMDEVWERLAFDPTEVSALDAERVIAVVHTSGRAKGSGIEIDQELTHLWTLSDGKAVRFETYSTKWEALEAAGLPG
ncbi:MAG TPA: nuclear transport factor 2 family protein [Solirubrobacterales bacterium]|nr:nuclear transport factor 2 family protein [Solirubrobacterales bacterium]